jgi:hypothetical protein
LMDASLFQHPITANLPLHIWKDCSILHIVIST